MSMAQVKKVVDPFGEVNVHPAGGGKVRVTATILMEPRREGTQTGIALDGSGSMAALKGASRPGPRSGRPLPESDCRRDQSEKHLFGPPNDFGTGTQLLPAVKYFVERFKDARWGCYIFITDSELHDLDAVKEYRTELAGAVSTNQRKQLKFVLIGVGDNINEQQMEELDDLDTGTDVDLWDHKIAAHMRVL